MRPLGRAGGSSTDVTSYLNTVWVAIRNRIWECSREQVRAATNAESLGAEILKDLDLQSLVQGIYRTSGGSAVEVDREGPPPPEAWRQPISSDVDGVGSRTDPARASADVPEVPFEPSVVHAGPNHNNNINEVIVIGNPMTTTTTTTNDTTATNNTTAATDAIDHDTNSDSDIWATSSEPLSEPLDDDGMSEPAPASRTRIHKPEDQDFPGNKRIKRDPRVIISPPPGLETIPEEHETPGDPGDPGPPDPPVSEAVNQAILESVRRNEDMDLGAHIKLIRRAMTPMMTREREGPYVQPLGGSASSSSSSSSTPPPPRSITSSTLPLPRPAELIPNTEGKVKAQIEDFERHIAANKAAAETGGNITNVDDDTALSYLHAIDEARQDMGWSGCFETYLNGTHELNFKIQNNVLTSDGSFLASRGSEISLKKLSADEKAQFQAADEAEWDAITSTGAVKVKSLEESQLIRRRLPDRIVLSRLVRRWKPQEGTFAPPKAKSRWCVRGFEDPDAPDLKVYAPTPQSESILLFFQICVSLGFYASIADAKNAFCQSKKLKRRGGTLYVEPCEGLGVEPGCLIELVAPVYGLDDAPILWHETITSCFREMGYRKSHLDPCWYLKHDGNELVGMVIIEVDDLLLGLARELTTTTKTSLTTKLTFGKWKNLW